ncbi:hypothetical protein [[Clostridium] fimetarium]|uniref:Uncharacterized protein n=1 Tax=[Clostridium] fimetarium TaxID=99656 RepID=A0A1I0RY98_9FIRM|nr:hypothetical protein [[Clostridium] fimetarium]SEW46459.1 hypothetical protein SAMN05421659_1335 [[Clostridium] fimetarium]
MRKIIYCLKKSFILVSIMLLTLLIGCNKLSQSSVSNKSDIFKNISYDNIIEIDYWLGDQKLVINNQDDIRTIYDNFSTLELEEKPTINIIDRLIGHIIIEIVTKSETIKFGLLTSELAIDYTVYSVNKDVLTSTREIALKYK